MLNLKTCPHLRGKNPPPHTVCLRAKFQLLSVCWFTQTADNFLNKVCVCWFFLWSGATLLYLPLSSPLTLLISRKVDSTVRGTLVSQELAGKTLRGLSNKEDFNGASWWTGRLVFATLSSCVQQCTYRYRSVLSLMSSCVQQKMETSLSTHRRHAGIHFHVLWNCRKMPRDRSY